MCIDPLEKLNFCISFILLSCIPFRPSFCRHHECLPFLQFLSHHHTYKALTISVYVSRYARSVGLAESVSARKFLEAAMGSGNEQVFYSTFTFFSLRNTRLRGSAAFAKGGLLTAIISVLVLVIGGTYILLLSYTYPLYMAVLHLQVAFSMYCHTLTQPHCFKFTD